MQTTAFFVRCYEISFSGLGTETFQLICWCSRFSPQRVDADVDAHNETTHTQKQFHLCKMEKIAKTIKHSNEMQN